MNERDIYVTPVFERSLKGLAKRFPSVKKIYKNLLETLKKDTPGEEIKGHENFYKMRLGNPDRKKGKSGGFRVVYFLNKIDTSLVLVDIYSKTDQENEDWNAIKRAMIEFEELEDDISEEENHGI